MRSLTLHSASIVPANSKAADVARGFLLVRFVNFLVIATVGCVLDLATKYSVFSWRGMPRSDNVWWIWEGCIGVETATNSGALFGMGQGKSWLFGLLSIVALCGILYWLVFGQGLRDRLLTYSLGAIAGGVLGNLYDRLGLWQIPGTSERLNHVRDWILLQYNGYTWPNFNIADCLLVCGAGLLFWHSFREPKRFSSANDDSTTAYEEPT